MGRRLWQWTVPGRPANNNVYMLASVVPSGRSTTDVMFARSTDDGLTFSAPHRINDDPNFQSKWHWFGTLSVAPNGALMLSGTTLAMLQTTSIRSYSIPGALMVALPGRLMSR